jgi:F420-dependent methylenetetrahydromethanopterin dehydrogenase
MQRRSPQFSYAARAPVHFVKSSQAEPEATSTPAPRELPDPTMQAQWHKEDIMKIMAVAGAGLLIAFLVDAVVRLASGRQAPPSRPGVVDPSRVVVIDGRQYIPL